MQTTTSMNKGRKIKGKIQKMASKKVKTNGAGGGVKMTLGSIRSIIDSQPDLKNSLKEMVDTEKHIYDVSSKQVIKVAKYLKANWKTVVPALAVLGVGATLFRGSARKH